MAHLYPATADERVIKIILCFESQWDYIAFSDIARSSWKCVPDSMNDREWPLYYIEMQISEIWIKIPQFSTYIRKLIWKCHLQDGNHCDQASTCLINHMEYQLLKFSNAIYLSEKRDLCHLVCLLRYHIAIAYSVFLEYLIEMYVLHIVLYWTYLA